MSDKPVVRAEELGATIMVKVENMAAEVISYATEAATLRATVERVQAENARLREALTAIRSLPDPAHTTSGTSSMAAFWNYVTSAQNLARAALDSL